MSLKVIRTFLGGFVAPDEFKAISPQVTLAQQLLQDGSGEGSDFVGWFDLPEKISADELGAIQQAANRIRESSDVLVVVGIGGSYLGARAVIELLGSQFYNEFADLKIYFAGNSISPDYLNHILALCENKDFSVLVVSKSGTTTEPAIAFRALRELAERRYGAAAKDRIYAITDPEKGALKQLADAEGFMRFELPGDVGGRFSVLTPVGLLPIAAAGFDIERLVAGAKNAMRRFSAPDLEQNDCLAYAAARNILYRKGKTVEVLACYEPDFALMSEWFKQLFGESEGKDQKGIFPASVIFSTDLHSMGQYLQDGLRNLFETVVRFKQPKSDIVMQSIDGDLDGLNYLAGQPMSRVNDRALEATLLAHTEGGVPNIVIEVDAIDEENIGELIYFFEKACAVSGYALGVNPFNQPGVEAYKANMFALLGKPGYEDKKAALEQKLK